MARRHRLLVLVVSLLLAIPVLACEPVLPFLQVMVPALALYRSVLVLVIAVVLKSILFAVFERRIPPLPAACRMFLGNVLTSFVGIQVAGMIAYPLAGWLIGTPVLYLLSWLPSRRLVKTAPLAWLARIPPSILAGIMTFALLASCFLFAVGQDSLETRQLVLYWIIKLAAIFLALFVSMTLTTIWEEWVIWRLGSYPDGTRFFASALRANLYILLLIMLVPAVLILPKRLHSPDFLAHRHNSVASQTTDSHSNPITSTKFPDFSN